MRTKSLGATALVGLVLALTACAGSDTDTATAQTESAMAGSDAMTETDEAMEPSATEDEAMADDSMMVEARSGTFEGLNGKAVAGTVEVDGSEVVLSGFSSDEGPDLHVYLTDGTSGADLAAGVQVDVVAYDEASQTFVLEDVDAGSYDTVVIYCVKASAVFGAATLA